MRIPPPIPGYRDGRDRWRGADKHEQTPVHGETGVSFGSLEMSILDEAGNGDEQLSADTGADEGEVPSPVEEDGSEDAQASVDGRWDEGEALSSTTALSS